MGFGGVIHINKKSICVLASVIIVLVFYLHNDANASESLHIGEVNLFKLLKVAVKAAENGGKEVVRVKNNIKIDSKGLTKEGQLDRVTTADFLSHCSMVATMKHFFPSVKVVSEEAKTKCEENNLIDDSLSNLIADSLSDEYVPEKDVTVWIDPLDATQEYTEKLYNYVTTMVCVAVKGKAVIGIIHKPFNSTTSWAWLDNAISKDLASNSEIPESENEDLKIVVSRSHSGKIKEVLQKNLKRKFQLISAAGAGYKALEVATKRADAYLHITAIKKWDICAGNAIINALGGTMTTKLNGNINYADSDDVVNSNGLIVTMQYHDVFLGLL